MPKKKRKKKEDTYTFNTRILFLCVFYYSIIVTLSWLVVRLISCFSVTADCVLASVRIIVIFVVCESVMIEVTTLTFVWINLLLLL